MLFENETLDSVLCRLPGKKSRKTGVEESETKLQAVLHKSMKWKTQKSLAIKAKLEINQNWWLKTPLEVISGYRKWEPLWNLSFVLATYDRSYLIFSTDNR